MPLQVTNPQYQFSNGRSAGIYFYTKKLMRVDCKPRTLQTLRCVHGFKLFKHFRLKALQVFKGDVEKVSASTGRIEYDQIAQAVLDGNSHYYLMLEDSDAIYDVSVADIIDVIKCGLGEQVTVTYKEDKDVNTVTKLDIGEKAKDNNVGAIVLLISEQMPKVIPRIAPAIGPSTIAPRITGMCTVVALIIGS